MQFKSKAPINVASEVYKNRLHADKKIRLC